jgi:glycine cleavage system H lipoate-binding protein
MAIRRPSALRITRSTRSAMLFTSNCRASAIFESHEAFGSVESVKAVSEIFTPIAGEVVEVNEALNDDAEAVNTDPYGEAWMIKIKMENPLEADAMLSPPNTKNTFRKSNNEKCKWKTVSGKFNLFPQFTVFQNLKSKIQIQMRYIPNSPEERDEMLKIVGLNSADELFRSIPQDVQLNRALKHHRTARRTGSDRRDGKMAAKNGGAQNFVSRRGRLFALFADVVDHLIQRSEFFTSYTPYQPEISQGTLQYIFEFQTLVCQLTGMDVANASMYDGSTSMAEAFLMAQRVTRRDKSHRRNRSSRISGSRENYTQHGDSKSKQSFRQRNRQNLTRRLEKLDDKTAALVVQSPNFFGCVEDLQALADKAHAVGALLIVVVTEAISFGLLKTPGECGADIVVAEGQSFGIPLSFGGPYVGLFAARKNTSAICRADSPASLTTKTAIAVSC